MYLCFYQHHKYNLDKHFSWPVLEKSVNLSAANEMCTEQVFCRTGALGALDRALEHLIGDTGYRRFFKSDIPIFAQEVAIFYYWNSDISIQGPEIPIFLNGWGYFWVFWRYYGSIKSDTRYWPPSAMALIIGVQ